MTPVLFPTTEFSTGLVPVFVPQNSAEQISDDEAAMRIEILRRRQLERADVREQLIRYAMQRREATR